MEILLIGALFVILAVAFAAYLIACRPRRRPPCVERYVDIKPYDKLGSKNDV